MAEKTKDSLKAFSKAPTLPATSADFQMKLSYAQFVDVVESALNVTDGGTVAGALGVTGDLSAVGVNGISPSGMYPSVPGVATALPANGALLVKNTYYSEDTTNGEAFLLPTISNSTMGDWIVVRDSAGFANNEKITIGSAANGAFAIGCHIKGINVTATAQTQAVDISISTDNSIIMEGETNGAGGAGSFTSLYFNGTAWQVCGEMYNIGNGSVAVIGGGGYRFAATS
tara:strand:+ start:203 stop:889 length:687 start_codon:yes stop_codon:yes gene_type:complete